MKQLAAAATATADHHPPEPPVPEPLDAETQQLVQATWKCATQLLARATHVAMEVQTQTNPNSSGIGSSKVSHMSRSLETQCRHVDYVLTGQHRPLSPKGGFEENNGVRQPQHATTTPTTSIMEDHPPPPIDLFDLLLAELQSLVVSVSYPPANMKT
jgi:hypothetical protein